MDYKVQNSIKAGQYESKFGTMYKYLIQFEGVSAPTELSQKPETPEPKQGDILHGTIADTQYGKKFTKVQKDGQGAIAGGRAKEFKADPLKQASIEKQVALKCAVELLSAKLPQLKEQPKSGELAKSAITIAKAFDEFLKESVESDPEPASVVPSKEEENEVKNLLDSAEEINVDEIPF